MARFVPNPRFESQARQSREMREAIRRATEPALREAQRLAPVDSGEYRDSLQIVEDADGVRLMSDDDKASFIEFGTEDTPAFAPLRKGTEAAGLRTGRRR